MLTKIKELCRLITEQQQAGLKRDGLDCEANLNHAISTYKEGRKYINVNIGQGGRYMVEKETGRIYGIKAYGVIHRGYLYGTLETMNDFDWSGYRAHPKIKPEVK